MSSICRVFLEKEIPRFLPLIRSAIGKGKDLPLDNRQLISSRAIFKFATRLQEHLSQCAKVVTSGQAQIVTAIKSTDLESSATASALTRKKRSYAEFVATLQHIDEMNKEVAQIQNLLQNLVPQMEALNELLPSNERLGRLDLRGILESSASSVNSTPSPRRRPNSSAPQSQIEEIRVRDLA
ncbi:hypothetical protein WR25_16989 [Diploscapter pachys]|uniref:BLOC-1-related complex subunit 5 n=1 Tax=Diploscapter pachys TaxID=2018661 RepID=A0A2A2JKX6_9BILA|nr:hypothetical protein WR25_16989 [Diploscapter pachys]